MIRTVLISLTKICTLKLVFSWKLLLQTAFRCLFRLKIFLKIFQIFSLTSSRWEASLRFWRLSNSACRIPDIANESDLLKEYKTKKAAKPNFWFKKQVSTRKFQVLKKCQSNEVSQTRKYAREGGMNQLLSSQCEVHTLEWFTALFSWFLLASTKLICLSVFYHF